MDPFRGATALITGAGSGLGRAIAFEWVRRGGLAVLADIDGARAETAASEITAAGGGARAVPLDVADAAAFAALCRDLQRRHGRLDVLFNNAGIAVGGDLREIDDADLQRIVDVNLWGVINGVRAAYPLMAEQRGGHIVNTASVAGLVPFATAAPYAMTKHAVVGLSLSLRAEAAALGVRVSVVCPGFIHTAIFSAARMAGLADGGSLMTQLPVKPMAPELAARRILDGVARNRALIVFPFYARLLWWLQRCWPSALQPLGRHLVARYRTTCAAQQRQAP